MALARSIGELILERPLCLACIAGQTHVERQAADQTLRQMMATVTVAVATCTVRQVRGYHHDVQPSLALERRGRE